MANVILPITVAIRSAMSDEDIYAALLVSLLEGVQLFCDLGSIPFELKSAIGRPTVVL